MLQQVTVITEESLTALLFDKRAEHSNGQMCLAATGHANEHQPAAIRIVRIIKDKLVGFEVCLQHGFVGARRFDRLIVLECRVLMTPWDVGTPQPAQRLSRHSATADRRNPVPLSVPGDPHTCPAAQRAGRRIRNAVLLPSALHAC